MSNSTDKSNILVITKRSIALLSKTERRKMYWFSLAQLVAGTFDLVGVALIGIIGIIAVGALKGSDGSLVVSKLVDLFGLDLYTQQMQVGILSALAAAILIIRSILSIVVTRRAYVYLALLAAEFSSNLMNSLLNATKSELRGATRQEQLFALTEGSDAIFLGILGGAIILTGDIGIILFLFSGLIAVNPVVAFFSTIYFILIFFVLSKFLGKKASDLGVVNAESAVQTNILALEVFAVKTEILLRGSKTFFADKFEELRKGRGDSVASMSFLPFIPKYVIETAIILGCLFLGLAEFSRADASHAVSTLTIFLTASFRIAPSLLRIQQVASTFQWKMGAAKRTFELVELLEVNTTKNAQTKNEEADSYISQSVISIQNVQFGFEDQGARFDLRLDIEFSKGEFVALVGPSGGGKTTTLNLILGALEPKVGNIRINGTTPAEAALLNPGQISYVPQEVNLISGTIKENLLLGIPQNQVSETELLEICSRSGLKSYIDELPFGLDSNISESGAQLSGGQRQRLGIARSLVSKPSILLLDEATSSLDAETESLISSYLDSLKGNVTVIVIAHRLSTVMNASRVLYMADGKIQDEGTFNQLRLRVPDFDRQASLLGL
jgi:ABC-type multidrug transport system fused ATPase/permease subunit